MMNSTVSSFENIMKYTTKKYPGKFKFDFEIGYLVKSPCKDCNKREKFPECIDACQLIDKIHEIMAESISCTRRI